MTEHRQTISAGMADEDWKHLKFYGYAPGGYLCRCGECGQQHEADKRAATCRSCAEKLHADHQAFEPVGKNASGDGI